MWFARWLGVACVWRYGSWEDSQSNPSMMHTDWGDFEGYRCPKHSSVLDSPLTVMFFFSL